MDSLRTQLSELEEEKKSHDDLIRKIKIEMPRIVPDDAIPGEIARLSKLIFKFDKAARRVIENPNDDSRIRDLAISRFNLAAFLDGKR